MKCLSILTIAISVQIGYCYYGQTLSAIEVLPILNDLSDEFLQMGDGLKILFIGNDHVMENLFGPEMYSFFDIAYQIRGNLGKIVSLLNTMEVPESDANVFTVPVFYLPNDTVALMKESLQLTMEMIDDFHTKPNDSLNLRNRVLFYNNGDIGFPLDFVDLLLVMFTKMRYQCFDINNVLQKLVEAIQEDVDASYDSLTYFLFSELEKPIQILAESFQNTGLAKQYDTMYFEKTPSKTIDVNGKQYLVISENRVNQLFYNEISRVTNYVYAMSNAFKSIYNQLSTLDTFFGYSLSVEQPTF